MVEAVGHENLPNYFAAIARALRPGGLAVIQVGQPGLQRPGRQC